MINNIGICQLSIGVYPLNIRNSEQIDTVTGKRATNEYGANREPAKANTTAGTTKYFKVENVSRASNVRRNNPRAPKTIYDAYNPFCPKCSNMKPLAACIIPEYSSALRVTVSKKLLA